jgi:hypothetical protein
LPFFHPSFTPTTNCIITISKIIVQNVLEVEIGTITRIIVGNPKVGRIF